MPARGAIEAEISNAASRFQREQQGRGPLGVRVHLLGDLVLIRSTGIFTLTEDRLSGSDEGRKLIRSARQELRSINHQEIEDLVAAAAGCRVLRSFYDVDVQTGEQVELFVLEIDVEKQLEK